MSSSPGTHTARPRQRHADRTHEGGGAAAKAAHNLVIEVTAGGARSTRTREQGHADRRRAVDARARGPGGMLALGDDDKANIEQTIDEEVLKGTAIAFESTR